MTYKKAIEYLLNQLPVFQNTGKVAYREGLGNAWALDAYFNNPHASFRTIHVAGTNGKGSVSHMIASVLQEAGYTVGLFTSPHLIDFRERIRVNGRPVNQQFVARFVEQHKSYFSTLNVSFFEISVFLAFTWFVTSKVNVAVVEVGLGGRLDTTNIIRPDLTVITNIGKDHTEILGDTLVKIASEKAGIFKSHTPALVGESQPEIQNIFLEMAASLQAPLQFADLKYSIDYSLQSVDGYQVFNVRKGEDIILPNLKCGLLGHCQRKNAVTTLAAIDILRESGYNIPEKHVYAGIRKVIGNTGLMGRWQFVSYNPQAVCDTAHNAEGLQEVARQIRETPHRKMHLIMGFVNDKSLFDIFRFFPQDAAYYFTRLSVGRTMDEKEIARIALQQGISGSTHLSVTDAYQTANKAAGKNDLIVITGSNFLVADFLKSTQKHSA
jgi:dihydrofolate synthase/folylpolyglutamate synthase